MIASDSYGTLWLSARTLFDDFSSNYSYVDYGSYQNSFDAFLMLHMTITRVFLFNYVVAVLTSIYQFMIVEGEYTYFRIRYLFYKKYQKLYVSEKNFIA